LTLSQVFKNSYNEHRPKAAANVKAFVNHDSHNVFFLQDSDAIQNKILKTNCKQYYVNVKG
jgi:hypothetical protein